jgi:hypothetical protein
MDGDGHIRELLHLVKINNILEKELSDIKYDI